jgi:hypothetical protein
MMKFLKPLQSALDRLGSVPSVVYILIYLAFIPAFATMYMLIGSSFVHTNAGLEYSLHRDVRILEATMAAELSRRGSRLVGDSALQNEVGTVDPTSLVVHIDLDVQEKDVMKFDLHWWITRQEGGRTPAQGRYSATLSLIWQFEDRPGYKTMRIYLDDEETESPPEWLEALFPEEVRTASLTRMRTLDIPNSVVQIPYTINSAIHYGRPGQLSGSFWIMCYFSAVTITTLGFGDITPMSDLARALVAIESIMGILLIGLFLNSVTTAAASSQSHVSRFVPEPEVEDDS